MNKVLAMHPVVLIALSSADAIKVDVDN